MFPLAAATALTFVTASTLAASTAVFATIVARRRHHDGPPPGIVPPLGVPLPQGRDISIEGCHIGHSGRNGIYYQGNDIVQFIGEEGEAASLTSSSL